MTSQETQKQTIRVGMIGLMIASAILIVILFAGATIQTKVDQARAWEMHTHDVQIALLKLKGTLQDAESRERGFLLTGDPHELEKFQTGVGKVGAAFKAVRELTLNNADQQARMDEAQALVNSQISVLKQTIDLYLQGKEAEALTIANDYRRNDLMYNLRIIFNEMFAEETRLHQDRSERAEAFQVAARTVQVISLFLVLIVSTLTAMKLQRLISKQELDAEQLEKASKETFEANWKLLELTRELDQRVQERTSELADKVRELDFQKFALDEHAIVNFFNTQGRMIYVNDKYVIQTGFSREECLGQKHDIMSSGYHDPSYFESMWETITAGKVWHGDIKNKTKDGRYFWVDATIVPFLDEEGNPFQFVEIHTDITARKEAEEVLIKAHKQAEDANRTKSMFLANMSHEFRTPMNGVIGMAEILQKTELRADQERMVDTIRKSSNALMRVLNDILEISRLEDGQMSLDPQPTDLRQTLEDIIETFRPSTDSTEIHMHFTLDPTLPRFAKIDSSRLRQIVINLLANAIKFSKPSEGRSAPLVHLKLVRSGPGHFRISVADEGIGMTAEEIRKVFEPFKQSDQSATRKFGGAGLGLALVKKFSELMGGDVSVNSTPGKGSEFTVTLPLEEAQSEETDPDISGTTILALVSEFVNRDGITAYLTHKGATIDFFDDEEAFKDKARVLRNNAVLFIALNDFSENRRIRQEIMTEIPDCRTLIGGELHDVCSNCAIKDCRRLQLSPILYSELINDIATLSKDGDQTESQPDQGGEPVLAPNDIASLRVLYVEDNPINQIVVRKQLEMLGCEVEIAENGQVALEKWQGEKVDFILSDCHMPVMDGYEMTRQIRKIESETDAGHVPIVALTANSLKGEAETCLQSGMDAFLSKPVGFDELRSALHAQMRMN